MAANAVLTFAQLFEPTVLTTSAALLYTVPTTPTTSLMKNARVRFTNTTGGSVTVTAYAVPSGGSAAVGNEFASALPVAANSNLDVDVPMLGFGDAIYAKAGGAGVNVLAMDGVLFTGAGS